ncbi:MAG TPA: glutamate 5-kinase [Firmicutes bacterium]|nr:glutamate 5-kinase [Bacillota bacterium]
MSIKQAQRIVVKVGSSTLTYPNGRPHFRRIEQIARVVADLKNSGKQVILVSSGAIAVGVSRLGLHEKPQDTPGKQAAAAVGQCDLMSIYDRFFSEYGYVAAQILINRDVVEREERKNNVVNTMETLLQMGAVPIINENDSVSVEELEFGDNDRLSAIVAVLAGADALLILTDIDGFYDSDPRENPDARLIAVVEEITPDLLKAAGGAGSNRGTGGMHTKLEAADFATKNGIEVAVMAGDRPERIYDLLEGRGAGTVFKAHKA